MSKNTRGVIFGDMGLQEYNQLSFLTPEFLESLEARRQKEPFLTITIDSTPSYDFPLLNEQLGQALGEQEVSYFYPSTGITPLDLIKPINETKILRKIIGTNLRLMESSNTSFSKKHINVIFESPISSIAWLLYSNKVEKVFPEDQYKILLGVQKHIIKRFSPAKLATNSLHILRVIPPDRILTGNLTHFSNEEIELLQKDIPIFNGCLIKSAKIASECIHKEIVFINT